MCAWGDVSDGSSRSPSPGVRSCGSRGVMLCCALVGKYLSSEEPVVISDTSWDALWSHFSVLRGFVPFGGSKMRSECGRLQHGAGSPHRALLEGAMGCAISALCQPTWYLESSEHTHAVQIHAPGAV